MTTPAPAPAPATPQPPTVEQAVAALQRLADAAALAPLPFQAHQANADAARLIHSALNVPRMPTGGAP